LDAGQKGPDEPLHVLRAYLLAHRAYREDGREGDISYMEMVRVATDWLTKRVALPPFEVWLEDYRAHPEKYEEYFMGLWKTDTEDAPDA